MRRAIAFVAMCMQCSAVVIGDVWMMWSEEWLGWIEVDGVAQAVSRDNVIKHPKRRLLFFMQHHFYHVDGGNRGFGNIRHVSILYPIRYDRVNLCWGWGGSPPARLARARYAATPSAGLCPATPRPRPHVSRFRVGCLHVRHDKPRPNTKGPSLTGA